MSRRGDHPPENTSIQFDASASQLVGGSAPRRHRPTAGQTTGRTSPPPELSWFSQGFSGGGVTNRALASPGSAKAPHLRGLRSCAEEDSNLHPGIPGQGPQPCASTNSATGAGGMARARGPLAVAEYSSATGFVRPARGSRGRGRRGAQRPGRRRPARRGRRARRRRRAPPWPRPVRRPRRARPRGRCRRRCRRRSRWRST